MFKKLNKEVVDFLVSKNANGKIEVLNGINMNVFCYENKMVDPVYLSNRKFDDSMDLLLLSNKFVSHYVYSKGFKRLIFNKTKHKGRKVFGKSCLQSFSSEKVLIKHKEYCLMINGKNNVELEKRFIEIENFNRQIPVPFKIYVDFECVLKGIACGIDNNYFSYTKKYQDHIPCNFAYKVVCIDDKFSKDIVLYRGENPIFKFIISILREYGYCKKVITKYFCKNLIMTASENEKFETTNICWNCAKLVDFDEKVRDHCHITGKYREAAHWSCNINLKINKKFPAIFHNLEGYDSHLIFKELSKFNCKISVIPNGLEKYMSFSLNNNIAFIDSISFMNSSLD